MMWWTRKDNGSVVAMNDGVEAKPRPQKVEKVLESCPSNAVCAYEYKGQLYKTEDEIKKVKELEVKRATEARIRKLAVELAVAFEKRKGLDRRYAGMAVTYLHRDAIQDLLDNFEEVGELLRKAKGIRKIEKVSASEYKVVDE